MHGVPWREVNTGAFFFSHSPRLSLRPARTPFSRFFLPHNKEAVARVDLQRLPVLGNP